MAWCSLSIYPTFVDFREWTRLAGESDAAYAAFQDWLHSTDSNGFRQGLYDWARSRQDDEWTSQCLGWAAVDHWITRAKCYDTWVGKRAVVRNFPMCAPAMVLLVKLATVELERLSAQQDQAEFSGTIDPRVVERFLRLALTAEKESKRMDVEAAARPSQAAAEETIDWMKLDVEELRLIEPLLEKARIRR